MSDPTVFISYRRSDSADVAARIYDLLVGQFGRTRVFKDVNSIVPGSDFCTQILEVLQECQCVLVLIGPQWLDTRDDAGARRLDDPSDWVRIEIMQALAATGVAVVPVLVNDAAMPSSTLLPDCLQGLARLHALRLRSGADHDEDLSGLIDYLSDIPLAARDRSDPESLSSVAWRSVMGSLELSHYDNFLKAHPTSTEAQLAVQHRRQLEVWNTIDQVSVAYVGVFLSREPFAALKARAEQALEIAFGEREKARAGLSEDDKRKRMFELELLSEVSDAQRRVQF